MKLIQATCYAVALALGAVVSGAELNPLETLGKALFFDANLSSPPGQSCASCHAPEVGWTSPDLLANLGGGVVHGAIKTRSGNRKPPSAAYAGAAPVLHLGCGCMKAGCGCQCGCAMTGECQCSGETCSQAFVGGMFWDGRATGWLLDDPLAEQAMGPFLNPLEQNNPNMKLVCLSVGQSSYAALFEEVWGPGSLDCKDDVEGTYERIARSIAAYERSSEVNPFSSKFDKFWGNARANGLNVCDITMGNMGGGGMGGGGMGGGGMGGGGMGNIAQFQGLGLEQMELMGLAVFNTVGKCSVCHLLTPGPENTPPLFTDFRYHNLGIPKNPENPFYQALPKFNPAGAEWVDRGLGDFLSRTAEEASPGSAPDLSAYAQANLGKHKTPTLRNVDKRPSPEFVKAFGHNGYFKSLMDIVHFYNTRDTLPICEEGGEVGVTCWPPPEVPENINRTELGDLGLMQQQGMALIMFLQTLTDGFAAEE